DEQLKNHHIIFIGDIRNWDALAKSDALLLTEDEDERLSVYDHGFVAETAKYVSFTQPSIWNEDRTLAVFTNVHPKETDFVSKQMMDKLRDNKLAANIVVETVNGEVFSNELVNSGEEESAEKEQTETNSEPW